MSNEHWLLPEGIEELLPADARSMESLRRRLLDLFSTWGYELVIPPFVEYTESLLSSMGQDLDLKTFKLVDQKSGRMMGIRADMTPQVARIDAHQLASECINRLCYIGTVLMTQSSDLSNSRSLTQIGAELYGSSELEADVEVLSLMLEMLNTIGVPDLYLDLGHVSIFRGLAKQAALSEQQEQQLFDAMQRKAQPEVEHLLQQLDCSADMKAMLAVLPQLNGGKEVLQQAREQLKSADGAVHTAIEQLQALGSIINDTLPQITVHYDLAEMRGYHYHTGVVFAAYQAGLGQAIAQGGRYDDIGKIFGRARPATGFSADLRAIINALANIGVEAQAAIMAPNDVSDVSLRAAIRQLRESGERVIQVVPKQQGSAADYGCNRQLLQENGSWVVKPL